MTLCDDELLREVIFPYSFAKLCHPQFKFSLYGV